MLVIIFHLSVICVTKVSAEGRPDDYYDDHCPLPDYTLWTSTPSTRINKTNDEFQEYPHMKLMKRKARLATYDFMSTTDTRQCIRNCIKTPTCVSLNAIKKLKQDGGEMVTCELFSTHDGFFLQKQDTTFFSKYAPRCPGYCEKFQYLKVCGQCKCVGLCHSNLTHYCDCTEQIKDPPQKNCSRALIKYGKYPLSALYNIDTGRQTLEAMCQFLKYNVVEVLWVALYRRLHLYTRVFDKNREEYRYGFNKPFHDNFFIGYDKIAALTNTGIKMTLGVALVTIHKEDVYIEYDGFKMMEVDANRHFYKTTYDRVRCLYCVNNFLDESGHGGKSKCPEYDLLKRCYEKGKIRIGLSKKPFISITYVLRPQKFNRIIEPPKKIVVSRQHYLGQYEGRFENCLVFEFSASDLQGGYLILFEVYKKGTFGKWHQVFIIVYDSLEVQFRLHISGLSKPLSIDLPFVERKTYRVQLSVVWKLNNLRNIILSINDAGTNLIDTDFMDMTGTLRINAGTDEANYKPFFLEKVYFNGQDLLKKY